jgi:hypothetical protein
MATIPLTDSGLKKKINDCEKVIAGGGEAKANIADGGGLTLQRQPSGAWLWFYRYRFGGKPSRLSLGAYPTVTLAQARETHRAAKDTLAQGINPSQERKETKLKQAVAIQNDFKSVARAWWDSWRGDKTAAHAAKVWANLEKDVFTVMGNRAVDSIKPAIIRLTVQGVVKRGALDTAARVHQYIRSVLNYAVAHELIEANPAIGLLLNDIIPKRKTKNQERIDLKELPQLLRDMDAYDGHVLTRYALQLINMTFVRNRPCGGRVDYCATPHENENHTSCAFEPPSCGFVGSITRNHRRAALFIPQYQRRWQDNEQQHHTLCVVSHGLQGAHDGARLSRGGIDCAQRARL